MRFFPGSHDDRFSRRGKFAAPLSVHRPHVKVLHEATLAIPKLPASLIDVNSDAHTNTNRRAGELQQAEATISNRNIRVNRIKVKWLKTND